MYKIILFILIILFFNSCGSSGSFSNKKTAYLIDSAISGVEYTCNEISGITGDDGAFDYDNSCKIVFNIGGIVIGEINNEDINKDNKVLPADLFGLARENIKDEKIIKLIQFLQAIDKDNNPDNNIQISEETRKKLKDCFLDFSTSNYEEYEIIEVLDLINKKLISKEEALIHYKKTLQSKFNLDIKENLLEEKLTTAKQIQTNETTSENFEERTVTDKINDYLIEEVFIEKTYEPKIKKNKFPLNKASVELETIKNKETNNHKGFSYANQRDITINISAKDTLYNKQILIYEKMSTVKTPVGDFEKLENLIISTIFDENGELNLTYTLGNHITSIWLVVPYYGLTTQIPIDNNNIKLTVDN